MSKIAEHEIVNAVNHSGFPLEHYIGNKLREHGWSIITNRYYIDDIKGEEREIDILAYKASNCKDENICYYTCLIVSCKKSDKNAWCFLTRQADSNNVNIDWAPLHYKTLDKKLIYMLENEKDRLVEIYKSNRATRHLFDFHNSVFAYQQIVEVKNDSERKALGNYKISTNTDIHNSIITSIKALSAEKDTLSKPNRFYSFNILSVFDGNMYEDYFDDAGNQIVKEIDEIKYLNRHIVRKKEDYYIVHFVNKNNFDYRLRLFDILHEVNLRSIPRVIDLFYKDIFDDKEKVKVIWSDFEQKIKWQIGLFNNDEYKILEVDYYKEDSLLKIEITSVPSITQTQIDILNNNKQLMSFVRLQLQSSFRYNGEFVFIEGLPI